MRQLQFITHQTERYTCLQSAQLALEGGCRWIQLRMKGAAIPEVEETAVQVQELCRRFDARFIINDHPAVALKVGADGVHLGKHDLSVPDARRLLGEKFIIGGTANTFEDIRRLASEGVNYIGLGPFRYTTTKQNLSPLLGQEGYTRIMQQCRDEGIRVPVVAIGGITITDIPSILETGVAGIALSSSILQAPDPVKETRSIMKLLSV